MNSTQAMNNLLEYETGFFHEEMKREDFSKIVESLFSLSEELSQNEHINKKLVFSMCQIFSSMRTVIVEERKSPSNIKLYSSEKHRKQAKLWFKLIESIFLDLLFGLDQTAAFLTIASYEEAYNMNIRFSFLVPIYIQYLENSLIEEKPEDSFYDDEKNVCVYLERLEYSDAFPAIEVLGRIEDFHKSEEVRRIAKEALKTIQRKKE